jgi:hypothetical protein
MMTIARATVETDPGAMYIEAGLLELAVPDP